MKGEFAYSSDLWAEGCLGRDGSQPPPAARIRAIETAEALTMTGVMAVLTSDDVPGRKTYGLEIPDQPVLPGTSATRASRSPWSPPTTPRPPAGPPPWSRSTTRPSTRWSTPRRPWLPGAPPLHPRATSCATSASATATRTPPPRSWSPANTRSACRTRPSRAGPESGLAVLDEQGGVDLYVSTQWLHVDRASWRPVFDLPPEQVRITLAGVGGAFGAREDPSMQIHACLLALRTGRR